LLRNSTIKENVRVWLKAPNTFEQHYDACEKRHKDTGNWFIHGEKFQHWLKRKGSFLWLNGFAGSGKSILASTVIQETLARVETSQSTGLAYFYFSYADSSKQSCRSLLSSLILQLSCQSSSEILNELYAEYFAGGPPQYALEKAFKLLVAKFEVTYIVIDALDESPVGLLRDSVCKLVCQLRELSSLHLFVTSRSEPDIRAALKVPAENDVSIQNEEALDDIRRYIGEQLQNDSFSKWENYHREIEDALSRGSHGMYKALMLIDFM
jgi:ankyrin repeat domain-containing protein 50